MDSFWNAYVTWQERTVKKPKKAGNIAELRSFLSRATYPESVYRFVSSQILRKGQNWEWGDQQNCTFRLLKESLEDTKTNLDHVKLIFCLV